MSGSTLFYPIPVSQATGKRNTSIVRRESVSTNRLLQPTSKAAQLARAHNVAVQDQGHPSWISGETIVAISSGLYEECYYLATKNEFDYYQALPTTADFQQALPKVVQFVQFVGASALAGL